MNVAYRDSSTLIVDQCRNLWAALIARWLREETGNDKTLHDELGNCLSAVKHHFGEGGHRLVRASLETVNLLQSPREGERAGAAQLAGGIKCGC